MSDGEKINSRSSFEACVNIVLNIILRLVLATGLAGREHTSAHLAGDCMKMMGLVKGVCGCVCAEVEGWGDMTLKRAVNQIY